MREQQNMSRAMKLLLAAVLSCVVVGATQAEARSYNCHQDTNSDGALDGALLGGLLGALLGNGSSGDILTGVLLGGFAGAIIDDLDKQEVCEISRIHERELARRNFRRNRSYDWGRNGGNYGTITYTQDYYRGRQYCRSYRNDYTVYTRRGWRTETTYGQYCQTRNGGWRHYNN